MGTGYSVAVVVVSVKEEAEVNEKNCKVEYPEYVAMLPTA